MRGAAAAELTLWAYAVGGGAARDVNCATMKELLIINEVGGKRCQHPGCRVTDEEDIGCMHLTWVSCTNAYQQYDPAVHGRPVYVGQTKSAQGATDLCSTHGGGKRCQHPGLIVHLLIFFREKY